MRVMRNLKEELDGGKICDEARDAFREFQLLPLGVASVIFANGDALGERFVRDGFCDNFGKIVDDSRSVVRWRGPFERRASSPFSVWRAFGRDAFERDGGFMPKRACIHFDFLSFATDENKRLGGEMWKIGDMYYYLYKIGE